MRLSDTAAPWLAMVSLAAVSCIASGPQDEGPVPLRPDLPLRVEQLRGSDTEVEVREIFQDGRRAVAIGQECRYTEDAGESWAEWPCPTSGRVVALAGGAAFIASSDPDHPGLIRRPLPNGSPEPILHGKVFTSFKARDGTLLVEAPPGRYQLSTNGGKSFSPWAEGAWDRLSAMALAEAKKVKATYSEDGRKRFADSKSTLDIGGFEYVEPYLLVIWTLTYDIDRYRYGEIDPPSPDAGIARTSDLGASWELLPIAPAHAKPAPVTPYVTRRINWLIANETKLAAFTRAEDSNHIMRSHDKGESWEQTSGIMWDQELLTSPMDIHQVAVLSVQLENGPNLPRWTSVHEGNEHAWIAGGPSGLLARSTDRGRTWAPLEAGTIHAVWRSGDVLITNGGVAGTLLRSDDGGQHWSVVEPGEPSVERLSRCSWNTKNTTKLGGDDNVVFLTGSVATTAHICRSRDHGQTWEPVWFREHGKTDVYIRPRSVRSQGGTTLILTSHEIFRSTDLGETWTSPTLPERNSLHVGIFDRSVMAFQDERAIIATTRMAWRSDDAGETWSVFAFDERIPRLEKAAMHGGTFIGVGRDGIILRSADGGASFQTVHEGGPSLFDVAHRDGTWVAVGARGRVMLSGDDGETWSDLETGLDNRTLKALDLAPDGSVLLFGGGGFIGRATQDGRAD
ncbi:MAG: hypothetical protein EA397_17225 [Deltaproteobacteria bacterium]|nr:MAG: hypothetical protein EA397_17225 [Deltaproteobacteria bacterium]